MTSLMLLLQKFTGITKIMSRADIPTIPLVLPMYTEMRNHLENAKANTAYTSLVRKVAEVGLQKLGGYQQKAIQCDFNIIGNGTFIC